MIDGSYPSPQAATALRGDLFKHSSSDLTRRFYEAVRHKMDVRLDGCLAGKRFRLQNQYAPDGYSPNLVISRSTIWKAFSGKANGRPWPDHAFFFRWSPACKKAS